MSGASVSIESLSHAFTETEEVLSDINLRVAPGEFLSLLGPSGSGKSTLLRLIAGLQVPSSGKVGVVSQGRGFFRGFVFQESHLLPWRNVLENTLLPLEIMGRSEGDARSAAKSALEKVGLIEALDKYPNQLSGGMKMRVSVARALVAEPSLLLLDEPFSALDEEIRELLQEDLRTLWLKQGITVVFVTHSVSEAVFLSDRALILSKGPGKIVNDHRVSLPRERTSELRKDPAYWREISEVTTKFRSAR